MKIKYKVRKADSGKWQVGFWLPSGVWQMLANYESKDKAQEFIDYLIGKTQVVREKAHSFVKCMCRDILRPCKCEREGTQK